MNVWNFTGGLGRDCETRFTAKGDAITSFSVAVNSGYGDNAVTTWANCSILGKRGEALAPYLLKGAQVAISGEFTLRKYTSKDGKEGTSPDVRVNDVTLLSSKAYRATGSASQESARQDDPDEEVPF